MMRVGRGLLYSELEIYECVCLSWLKLQLRVPRRRGDSYPSAIVHTLGRLIRLLDESVMPVMKPMKGMKAMKVLKAKKVMKKAGYQLTRKKVMMGLRDATRGGLSRNYEGEQEGQTRLL